MRRIRAFAIVTIVWNVLTILFGAVVRATGSGAGCGRSWPTCRGEVVPELEGATAVEFLHRSMSGVALVLVAVLVVWVLRSHRPGTAVRLAVTIAGVAIILEALIGAGIVLAEWVADDTSVARVIAVPLHLVNTLLLLAALTAVIRLIGVDVTTGSAGRLDLSYWLIAWGMVAIAATGAVTALADTLFPKDALGLETGAHFLTGLRVGHPIVAVVVGLAAVSWVRSRPSPISAVIGWLVLIQLAIGASNVVLSTPLALSTLHLLVADLLWIAWVWWGVDRAFQNDASRTVASHRIDQTSQVSLERE